MEDINEFLKQIESSYPDLLSYNVEGVSENTFSDLSDALSYQSTGFDLPQVTSNYRSSYEPLIKLANGFMTGFTTIDLGEQPQTEIESIAYSLGHLAGFIGFIPSPKGIIGKVASSSFGKAMGLAKLGAKWAGKSTNLIPTITKYGNSVPMALSGWILEGTKNVLKGPAAVARGYFSKGMVKFAEGTGGRILKDAVESGYRLAWAGGISEWQHGIDSMLENAAYMGAFGSGSSVLGSVISPKGALSLGRKFYPEVNEFTAENFNNPVWMSNLSKAKTIDNTVRALASSITMSNVPLIMGDGDRPLYTTIYDYLLNAYFGYKEVPWFVKKTHEVTRDNVKGITDRYKLMNPNKYFKDYDRLPMQVKDELELQAWSEFGRVQNIKVNIGDKQVGIQEITEAEIIPILALDDALKEIGKNSKSGIELYDGIKSWQTVKEIKDIIAEKKEVEPHLEEIKNKVADVLAEHNSYLDMVKDVFNENYNTPVDQIYKDIDKASIDIQDIMDNRLGWFKDAINDATTEYARNLGIKEGESIVKIKKTIIDSLLASLDVTKSSGVEEGWKVFLKDVKNKITMEFGATDVKELTPDNPVYKDLRNRFIITSQLKEKRIAFLDTNGEMKDLPYEMDGRKRTKIFGADSILDTIYKNVVLLKYRMTKNGLLGVWNKTPFELVDTDEIVKMQSKFYSQGKILLFGKKDDPTIILTDPLLGKFNKQTRKYEFTNSELETINKVQDYTRKNKIPDIPIYSKELQDHLRAETIEFLRRFNGYATIEETLESIKNKDILFSPVDINKRMQLFANNATIFQPDMKHFTESIPDAINGFKNIILNATNRGKFKGQKQYKFYEALKYLDKKGNELTAKAVKDGGQLVRDDVFDYMVDYMGYEKGIGFMKNAMMHIGDDGLGGYLGKLGSFKAGKELSELMKKYGIHAIDFDTTAKQKGKRKSLDWIWDDTHPDKLVIEDINEVELTNRIPEFRTEMPLEASKIPDKVETPTQEQKPAISTQKQITRKEVKNNPNVQYLFGDNLEHKGLGGQAKEMRGEPNAIGIPTKKKPDTTPDSYFTDNEYENNIKAIDEAFAKIDKDRPIVIPEAGLGTGLADLPNKAPKTFEYLKNKLEELKSIANDKQPILEGFNTELAMKIQDKLTSLYPELKLSITNKPIWIKGENIFNQEVDYNNAINYRLKAADILLSDKAKQVFKTLEKNKVVGDAFWNKIQKDLGIPKEQIELLKELKTYDREKLALELLSKYGFSIEINTALERYSKFNEGDIVKYHGKEYKVTSVDERELDFYDGKVFTYNLEPITNLYDRKTNPEGDEKKYRIFEDGLQILQKKNFETKLAKDYSKLSAPNKDKSYENKYEMDDDWEYQILRFETPAITPFIKGHPSFAKNRDIGWARVWYNKKTGAIEVQEIQSDIFQQSRHADIMTEEYFENIKDIKGNQFLQLLNKGNNWVTFFIKSIIQDSAKKGYEKVLFPKGETAAKIEGHETLAQKINTVDSRIKEFEEALKYGGDTEVGVDFVGQEQGEDLQGYKYYLNTDKNTDATTKLSTAINSLYKYKEALKSQGIEKLKPIEAFYEIKVGNILEKQFGKDNVKTITDEHGNQWREIEIKPERDLKDVLLQKDEANRIIGQADIKAGTVLIDFINQKQDTLPHEYAHHYIAWYREAPIVQEGIRKWGSEEKLVDAIGKQVVKQEGEAYNWWQKFIKWLKDNINKLTKLEKEHLTNILTDAFLTRKDLSKPIETKPEEPIKTEQPIEKPIYNHPWDSVRLMFAEDKHQAIGKKQRLVKQLVSNILDPNVSKAVYNKFFKSNFEPTPEATKFIDQYNTDNSINVDNIDIDDLPIKFKAKVISNMQDTPLWQKLIKDMFNLKDDIYELEDDAHVKQSFREENIFTYGVAKAILNAGGKITPAFIQGNRFFKDYFEASFKNYVITSTISPRVKDSAKGVLRLLDPITDSKVNGIKDDEIVLGAGFKGKYEIGDELVAIRIPSSDSSGAKVVKIKAFTDIDGYTVHLSDKNYIDLEGADNDADTVFLYKDMPQELKTYLKENTDNNWIKRTDGKLEYKDIMDSEEANAFKDTKHNDENYDIFDPRSFLIKNQTSYKGNSSLGRMLNFVNNLVDRTLTSGLSESKKQTILNHLNMDKRLVVTTSADASAEGMFAIKDINDIQLDIVNNHLLKYTNQKPLKKIKQINAEILPEYKVLRQVIAGKKKVSVKTSNGEEKEYDSPMSYNEIISTLKNLRRDTGPNAFYNLHYNNLLQLGEQLEPIHWSPGSYLGQYKNNFIEEVAKWFTGKQKDMDQIALNMLSWSGIKTFRVDPKDILKSVKTYAEKHPNATAEELEEFKSDIINRAIMDITNMFNIYQYGDKAGKTTGFDKKMYDTIINEIKTIKQIVYNIHNGTKYNNEEWTIPDLMRRVVNFREGLGATVKGKASPIKLWFDSLLISSLKIPSEKNSIELSKRLDKINNAKFYEAKAKHKELLDKATTPEQKAKIGKFDAIAVREKLEKEKLDALSRNTRSNEKFGEEFYNIVEPEVIRSQMDMFNQVVKMTNKGLNKNEQREVKIDTILGDDTETIESIKKVFGVDIPKAATFSKENYWNSLIAKAPQVLDAIKKGKLQVGFNSELERVKKELTDLIIKHPALKDNFEDKFMAFTRERYNRNIPFSNANIRDITDFVSYLKGLEKIPKGEFRLLKRHYFFTNDMLDEAHKAYDKSDIEIFTKVFDRDRALNAFVRFPMTHIRRQQEIALRANEFNDKMIAKFKDGIMKTYWNRLLTSTGEYADTIYSYVTALREKDNPYKSDMSLVNTKFKNYKEAFDYYSHEFNKIKDIKLKVRDKNNQEVLLTIEKIADMLVKEHPAFNKFIYENYIHDEKQMKEVEKYVNGVSGLIDYERMFNILIPRLIAGDPRHVGFYTTRVIDRLIHSYITFNTEYDTTTSYELNIAYDRFNERDMLDYVNSNKSQYGIDSIEDVLYVRPVGKDKVLVHTAIKVKPSDLSKTEAHSIIKKLKEKRKTRLLNFDPNDLEGTNWKVDPEDKDRLILLNETGDIVDQVKINKILHYGKDGTLVETDEFRFPFMQYKVPTMEEDIIDFDRYFPHYAFAKKELQEHLISQEAAIKSSYEKGEITTNEYNKQITKVKATYEAAVGKAEYGDIEYTAELSDILQNQKITSKKIENAKLFSSADFLKNRNENIPLMSYRRDPSAYLAWGEGNIKEYWNKLSAVLQHHIINNFRKDMSSKLDADSIDGWTHFMNLYMADNVGYPDIITQEMVDNPNTALKRNPYYYATNLPYKNVYKKVFRKSIEEEFKNKDLAEEVISRRVNKRLAWISRMDGLWQMSSLLTSPKSYIQNLFTANVNTIVNTGLKPWRMAGNLEYLQKINPEWKNMGDVTRSIDELGGIESFISEMYLTSQLSDYKARKFWLRVKGAFKNNPDIEDKSLLEIAKEEGLTDAWFNANAYFMRKSERIARRRSWLAHYIKIREVMEAGNNIFDWDDTYLVDYANKGVAATQFLYNNAAKPAFTRTHLGKVFTRFQTWTINSVEFRKHLLERASLHGAANKEHIERLSRMITADLFILSLATVLPSSLFSYSLPAPMSWLRDLSNFFFGDSEEKEKAFFGAMPYPMNIIQPILPPAARVPESMVATTAAILMGADNWDRYAKYTLTSIFPFNRMGKDILKSINNPALIPENTFGVPLMTGFQQISKARKRENPIRKKPTIIDETNKILGSDFSLPNE